MGWTFKHAGSRMNPQVIESATKGYQCGTAFAVLLQEESAITFGSQCIKKRVSFELRYSKVPSLIEIKRLL